MSSNQATIYREQIESALAAAGVVVTATEREAIELADLGLGEFARQGLGLVVYVNNERYCAKELVLLPRQTCPEHWHPPVTLSDGRTDPGKMETFRCRQGRVWLYVEGEGDRERIQAQLPVGSESYYTVFHEIELCPGDQYTIAPDTLHWFQGDNQGAVVSEFSTTSRDELDLFTDPRIRRV